MGTQADRFERLIEDSQRKRPHQNMIERCADLLSREHAAIVRAVKRIRNDHPTIDGMAQSNGYLDACDDILAMLEKRNAPR